jgi:hypothetical protein
MKSSYLRMGAAILFIFNLVLSPTLAQASSNAQYSNGKTWGDQAYDRPEQYSSRSLPY